MSISIEEFDFDLPEELIADEPFEKRDECRLLIVDRKSKTIQEGIFKEVLNYLQPSDLVVFNNSKVIKARIICKNLRTNKQHEVLFSRFIGQNRFEALVKNSRRVKENDVLECRDYRFRLVKKEGLISIFECETMLSISDIDKVGEIPLPPYIEKKRLRQNKPRVKKEDEIFYQTVFSQREGSIAAPTAGLHFTEKLIDKMIAKGIKTGFITLHVGLGTFEPIRVEDISKFRLKEEYVEVSEDIVKEIIQTKKSGKSVVAVGTTVVRSLESAALSGELKKFYGYSDLFIYPGFNFRVVDKLITNFHLPKSSLLLLVSAFAGKDLIMEAYNYAINKKFRFYSYGDAMLIL